MLQSAVLGKQSTLENQQLAIQSLDWQTVEDLKLNTGDWILPTKTITITKF